MSISVEAKDLVGAMRILRKVVKTRTNKPCLHCVRIRGESGRLYLDGTDLEVLVDLDIPFGGGLGKFPETLVNLESLWAACSKAKSDIVLDASDKTMKVESGGIVSEIETSNDGLKDTYPGRLDWSAFKWSATLQASDLLAGIQRTRFAVPSGSTRYSMNGILFSTRKGGLDVVASDTHRLSLVRYGGVAAGGADLEAIAVGYGVLAEVLKNHKGEIQIGCTAENNVVFKNTCARMMVRRIEGQFPRYLEVIPHFDPGHPVIDIADRESLLETLRSMKPLVNDETQEIKLLQGQDAIKLVAERGTATSNAVRPKRMMSIALNVNYLIDALSACETNSFEIQNPDSQNPIMFAEKTKVWTWTHVIMPIRAVSVRDHMCRYCGEGFAMDEDESKRPDHHKATYCSIECMEKGSGVLAACGQEPQKPQDVPATTPEPEPKDEPERTQEPQKAEKKRAQKATGPKCRTCGAGMEPETYQKGGKTCIRRECHACRQAKGAA